MYVWDDNWLAGHVEAVLEPDLPIVDAHHHLWDFPRLTRYELDDLHRDTGGGHRIEATIYVECGWRYRSEGPTAMRPVGETDAIATIESERVGGVPIAGIVAYADLRLGDAVGDVLAAHEAAGRGRFVGVRHATAFDPDPAVGRSNSRSPHGLMADDQFRAGVRRLAAAGLPLDAWLYHTQITELTALARAVPECRFVLDHLGGIQGVGPYAGRRAEILEQWQGDIRELATCPNVSIKLGGIGMVSAGLGFEHRPLPPSSAELVMAWSGPVLAAIEAFGPRRCMFESNFPVDKMSCSYTVLWNAFKTITRGYGESERASMFAGTARRVYGI